MTIEFAPYSDDWKTDPFPIYREMRDEAPVYFAKHSSSWCVFRYDDVEHVLKTPELFSSDTRQISRKLGPEILSELQTAFRLSLALRVMPTTLARSRMLILENGERHREMRMLLNRGFKPKMVLEWEKRIQELVAACIDDLDADGSFDVVSQLALPLPTIVIAEMLGVEVDRRNDFKQWCDSILAGVVPLASSDRRAAMVGAMKDLKRYLMPLAAARRRAPKDDLLTTLVEAQTGEAALSDHELFMFSLLLLIGGNETTTNLIANAVDALLANPSQAKQLAAAPSRARGIIEETLRFDSPVQYVARVATQEVELRGQRIPKGGEVVAFLGSANRDERRFADPDHFDHERDARGHMGFGHGAHFCLGASLARLEANAALSALAPQLPRLSRVTPEVELELNNAARGRARLELQSRS
jgi:cytochrome P450